jgi:aspartate/methionine/tyrosine aminotransferase
VEKVRLWDHPEIETIACGRACDNPLAMRFNSFVEDTELPPLLEMSARAGELAAAGADVIRLDQGAVDIPPPPEFVAAVGEALDDELLHRYTPDPGLPELRAALAGYLGDRLGVGYDPGTEIIVTAGANQGCFAALMALVEPGDEVLLPSPWYFNHAMTLTALGAVPVAVPTRADQGFAPSPAEVAAAISPRTRGLVLVNPNNPTGACYHDGLIRELTGLVIERGLWLLADQTYHELYFGTDRPLSPAAIDAARDSVVTVTSFSKSLGLSGWRLGVLAGPAALITEVLKVQDCVVISANRPGQVGLLATLPAAERHAERVRSELGARRDLLVTALREAGLDDFVEPGGSLFLLLRLPGTADDQSFCRRLLDEAQVVAVPGSALGPGGAGSIRISFGTTGAERLSEAVGRIAAKLAV